MGYRHYIGFTPKQKLEEIKKLSKEYKISIPTIRKILKGDRSDYDEN